VSANNFFQDYLIRPFYQDTFNLFNTSLYAVLFLILILVTIRIFKKLDISFNSGFYAYFILFIILGGILGFLKDFHYLDSPIYSTVGIYGLIFTLFLTSIIIGKLIEKVTQLPYALIPLLIAILSIVVASVNLPFNLINFNVLFVTLALAVLVSSGLFLGLKKLKLNLLNNKTNFGILFSQMLDASSTYIGITSYGFQEKFFIADYVMQTFTPVSIFFLKAATILIVLHMLEKSDKGFVEESIKAALIAIGLGPAVRNTLLSMFQ
jgi:uncharacterized membrane protein|tara:strand:+ start:20388 stop:21182 length:795 start_codon:yes stop_codon:yes gene_type:complete